MVHEVMKMDDESRRIREEVKKQFPTMTPAQKMEYIWMYYKWAIALIIAAVVLAFAIRDWVENAKMHQILGIMAINTDPGYSDTTEEDIKQMIGSEDKYETVSVYRNVVADPETGKFDYQSQMTFVTMLSAAEVDVILMPEITTDKLGDGVTFKNLEQMLPKDYKAGDGVSFDGPFMVLSKGNPVYDEFGFYYEPVYVGLLEGTKHEETAMDYLKALIN